MHIPVAYSAIGNATAPLFSALVGAALFGELLGIRKILGLMLGLIGVALTARAGAIQLDPVMLLAFGGTLLAALLYALAGAYMKTRAAHISALALGCGGQLAAAIWLLPVLFVVPADWQQIDLRLMLLMACAGVISTGLPYVVYFPLMRRIGVTNAMTVTFLVPCFAFFFGYVFLGEALTVGALAGCALVIAGLVLALRAPARVPAG
jgi:drug/metabolite transporter (DMT)-like permease